MSTITLTSYSNNYKPENVSVPRRCLSIPLPCLGKTRGKCACFLFCPWAMKTIARRLLLSHGRTRRDLNKRHRNWHIYPEEWVEIRNKHLRMDDVAFLSLPTVCWKYTQSRFRVNLENVMRLCKLLYKQRKLWEIY